MPRKAKELSPLEVRRLTRPGRWSVGGVDGLALQVTESGARSRVLRLRVAGTQREMGLGSFPTISLADARERVRQHRVMISQGHDPDLGASRGRQRRGGGAGRQSRPFSSVAAQYIAQHEKSWKNKKHGAQWTSTLETYAAPVVGSG